MHRLLLVDPWPLWVGALALGLLLWPGLRQGQKVRGLLPWVVLGAVLTSLAGGLFRPSLTWPLVDQWAGTRWWIKGPILLIGAFSLGLGLRLVRGRPQWLSGVTAVGVAVVLTAIARAVCL